MRRFAIIVVGALLVGGCQQPMQISQPSLARPQVAGAAGVPQARVAGAAQHPYQYLAPQQARHPWIPYAAHRQWRWIMIHHSVTQRGSAAMFDRYHRDVNHWEELGYHFVIGNGVGAGDGQVEVGPRWAKQRTGAHAGVKEYNEYGIGICLVGDFSQTRPTAAQMQSLARLTGYLMQAYRIPASRVIGHRDAKHTNCPGRFMDLGMVRAMAARVVESQTVTARIE